MSTIKCIKSSSISFWTHACLAHNICIISAEYSVSRITFLALPSSILDLRHQYQNYYYQHHVESNNHISINVSFTTISKHRREIAKSLFIFLSFKEIIQQKSSAVYGWTNVKIFTLCHHPFYYNPKFTDHLMGRLFYIAFFRTYSNLRIQKAIQI